MGKTLTFALLALSLAGCASSPKLANVVPQPGGIYKTTGAAETNEEAMRIALYTAEQTCKGQHKRHVVTAQEVAYKGVVSEGTNKAVNTAAQVVANLTGSVVPTLSSDDDYHASLTFQCEA